MTASDPASTSSATPRWLDRCCRWPPSAGVPLTVPTDLGDLGTGTREAFGADLVLVRPDQHIAWLGDHVSPATAPAVLTSALTGFAATAGQPATAGRPLVS